MTIEFTVIGRPTPAGSKTRNAAGALYDSTGHRGKSWRAIVQATAISHMREYGLSIFDCPIRVEMVFQRKRPQGKQKPEHVAFPTMKPDALKLARAVEDALTGICYTDDSLIVHGSQVKIWGDEWGCRVSIEKANPFMTAETLGME